LIFDFACFLLVTNMGSTNSFYFIQTSTNTKGSGTTTDPGDVSLTTVAGEIVTVTVPNGQPAETGASGEKQDDGSGLSGGAIAGIIIGVLAVVGSAFGLWLWFFCARRRREDERPNPEAHLDPTVPPSALYNGNGNHRPNRSSQMSMMRNLHSGHNRFSVPAFTDSRMKKDAVLYGNGPRESNVSLQDNQDYSRPVLRVSLGFPSQQCVRRVWTVD
jgi:cell wall integrity and stress response component